MSEARHQAIALEAFVAAGRHRSEEYGAWWGDPNGSPVLEPILREWLWPALTPSKTVLEIGAGGGRWSQYLIGHCRRAVLVDATPASEAAIRERYPWEGFRFLLSPDGALPDLPDLAVDYCWSFDTFVHFDPPLFAAYLKELGRVLRPGGLLHLHYGERFDGVAPDSSDCWHYQDAHLLPTATACGLEPTGRRLEIREGFGAVLVELRRADHDQPDSVCCCGRTSEGRCPRCGQIV